MPVSIADVARLARVSRGTVSHVMNGSPQARIGAETRERVHKAAADLGYRPNRIARSLGRRKTDTLGLVISGLQRQNVFYAQMIDSIESHALTAGYQVMVDTPLHNWDASAHVEMLRGWPIDGVILWTDPREGIAARLRSSVPGLPLVMIGGQLQTGGDCIYFDVYAGARLAMEHLVSRGYRRIAYLCSYQWQDAPGDEPRHLAYRDVCQEANIPYQPLHMERCEETRLAGLTAGMEIGDMPAHERPQAVLCWNDVIAQGFIFGLRRKGLRIPEDMAVAGFDGLDEGKYLDIPLTTVHLPMNRLCKTAVEMLISRISGECDTPAKAVGIPTELYIGGTT